jgi:uncharacterized metal-binding protein
MSSCCAGKKTLLFACSGGSNVGQLSNEAAKRLDVEGVGSFFCMAGVGAGLPGMVAKSKEADATVVIDGCDVGCTKAAFEREGVPITKYVVITDLGIEKGHHFNLTEEQIEAICGAAKGSCCCG